jgi:hypothetical protein
MPNLSRYLVIGSVIALLAVGLTVGLSDEKEAPKEAPKNPLLGTWELVKVKSDDGEFKDFPKEHRRVKLITDTHWSWVQYSTDGPKEVQGGAGGPYTLKGDNYVETIEFATKGMADFLDKSLAFKIRIDGDKCVVTGALPNGLGLEEIWQRVKAPLPPKAP